jgi:hypothetical protein
MTVMRIQCPVKSYLLQNVQDLTLPEHNPRYQEKVTLNWKINNEHKNTKQRSFDSVT